MHVSMICYPKSQKLNNTRQTLSFEDVSQSVHRNLFVIVIAKNKLDLAHEYLAECKENEMNNKVTLGETPTFFFKFNLVGSK